MAYVDMSTQIAPTVPQYNNNDELNDCNDGSYPTILRQQMNLNQAAARQIAYVKIIEQPGSKKLRFRYECEGGRSAGSIPGVNSTNENKTYPTIKVCNFTGPAIVIVSCVSQDKPYWPHPHNLVGKTCNKGVSKLETDPETMQAVFCHLGIQCVKKCDIDGSLATRKKIRVDPHNTGFSYKIKPKDLNVVRLCFQVFLPADNGRFTHALKPVVSDPIYDKKAISDLLISTICGCKSTVAGGTVIYLLCDKIVKDDISVKFFEEQNGQVVWQCFGDFLNSDVHKQTAIRVKTPAYKNLDVHQPVKVFIQLIRPSDGATSEPYPFEYIPLPDEPFERKRKRIQNSRAILQGHEIPVLRNNMTEAPNTYKRYNISPDTLPFGMERDTNQQHVSPGVNMPDYGTYREQPQYDHGTGMNPYGTTPPEQQWRSRAPNPLPLNTRNPQEWQYSHMTSNNFNNQSMRTNNMNFGTNLTTIMNNIDEQIEQTSEDLFALALNATNSPSFANI